MERFFARDVINAAKADVSQDELNAREISGIHGIDYSYVLKEIRFVRKNLRRIDPG